MEVVDVLRRKSRRRQLDARHVDALVLAKRPAFDDNGLDLVACDLRRAQLDLAVVQQQGIADVDPFRQVRVGCRDARRVAGELAYDDRQGLAILQRDRAATAQFARPDFRSAQVLEQRDDAPGVFGGAPHSLDDFGVAVVGAVREIEAKDIDARCDQLANAGIAGRRRSQRGDDLRPAHVDKVRYFRGSSTGLARTIVTGCRPAAAARPPAAARNPFTLDRAAARGGLEPGGDRSGRAYIGTCRLNYARWPILAAD